MRSILEFVFIYGHYCHHEWQLKRFRPAPEMNDPRLSVKALMQDNEEEIRWADMFKMFNSGMEQMGDTDSTLYAEPTSMAQVYNLMYAGAWDIGLLPPWSHKNKQEMLDVYKQ